MWAACGALLAGLLSGCGEQSTKSTGGAAAGKQAAGATKRIILLTNDTSPFWDAVRAGVTDAEKDLKSKGLNYQAILEVNDGTPQGQIDKLRQFGSQSDIVGVGISALDADNVAVADEMRKLQQKGIKVVTIDSDVSRETLRDARFAFIGTENFLAGKELGVCAKNLRPEGGGSVTFVGRKGAQNARERIGGFTEGAGAKFELLDTMEDNVKLDVARENVRNALRNHADKLTTLVGIWSYNAPAIVDVLKETGTRKKFTVVTFDAEPGAIVAMNDGMIDAMVVQNPYQMGYQGVRMLRALVEDDQATIKEMLPRQGN
jgi:ribose transport system substrate-binding protein